MVNLKSMSRLLSFIAVVMLSQGTFHLAAAQSSPRSPSDTVREFYKAMRQKKFREAFDMSIYKPAIDGLSRQEYEELLPDFEKIAVAISEKIPENLEFSGEQISGDSATVFLKVTDIDGKEKMEPATLIKVNGKWILGDLENQELVKKAGKQFFFDARINAHHNDVQDMLTRISLAQVFYSQQHAGEFGDMPILIAAGLIPKDIENTASTGYRFSISRSADRKSWSAAAEPAQYGRSGKLSFFLDSNGVKSADVAGKPFSTSVPRN
jgi:hypothetical protein